MGTERLNLLDVARGLDPKGRIAQVAEILHQTNAIIQDAPMYPSNAPMGNTVVMRSALPVVNFTKINQGSTRSKSTTEKRTDTIGLIDGLSEVDSKLRTIIGPSKFDAFRAKEDDGYLEAMAQTAALTAFYGDEKTNDASFTGLATRMSTLASALTGSQVWSYGTPGGGDTTSLYIVDWGERACKLIYPEESTAGIISSDKGEIRTTDIDGNPMMAFATHYLWSLGLSVEDPRHIARLANIDTSVAQTDTAFALGTALIDVLSAMPDAGPNSRVIYAHQRMFAAFYKQAINKTNAALSIRDYQGKPSPHFWEVPIRRCDQISINESTVS